MRPGAARRGRFHDQDPRALGDLRVLRHRDLADRAVDRGGQGVLHLHRLDDGDTLAARDLLALRNQHGKHLAVHRRAHQTAAGAVAGLVEREVA